MNVQGLKILGKDVKQTMEGLPDFSAGATGSAFFTT